MEELVIREQIVSTGKTLLEKGLVARTWGNVSARLDKTHFIITPSGLDYNETTKDDLAVYDMETDDYKGQHKPSSEKGVHKACYQTFEDVNFVIHTHQAYATAIGVYGFNYLDITQKEEEELGKIAIAEYALPGTSSLKNNVLKAFETGAHCVFMKNHGVVVGGNSMEDVLYKIELLEKICKRNVRGLENSLVPSKEKCDKLLNAISKTYPNARLVTSPSVLSASKKGISIKAQLDDSAQMIGPSIVRAKGDIKSILNLLKKHNAILIPKFGGIVWSNDIEDSKALEILLDKSSITFNHTQSYKVNEKLGLFDCLLMRFVYINKYSKRKTGEEE